MFSVNSENFTGPLDVLLNLIQKNKLDICEVSLSEIADEFLDVVANMNVQDVDMISDFIYISSKLIDMKSRYMLFIKADDEDGQDLVLSLEEYAKYKSLANVLKSMYSKDYLYFEKIPEEIFVKEELDLSKLTLNAMSSFMISLNNNEEQTEIRFTKRQKSLTEKINYIENVIEEKKTCYFDDVVTENEKDEKVVSMLGVLHLVKENIVNVNQQNNFDRIKIEKNKII